MNRQTTPSPLARAIGPGSAKKGLAHWWLERVTAVALLPLTIWFSASIMVHTHVGYGALISWLSAPLTTILMILLLIALFCHTALGLEVVIEDYVHSAAKGPIVVTMRLGCLALAVAGVLASLRIAFGG